MTKNIGWGIEGEAGEPDKLLFELVVYCLLEDRKTLCAGDELRAGDEARGTGNTETCALLPVGLLVGHVGTLFLCDERLQRIRIHAGDFLDERQYRRLIAEALVALVVLRFEHRRAPREELVGVGIPDRMLIEGSGNGVIAQEREVLEDDAELAGVNILSDEVRYRGVDVDAFDTADLDRFAERALVVGPVGECHRCVGLADEGITRPYFHIFDIDVGRRWLGSSDILRAAPAAEVQGSRDERARNNDSERDRKFLQRVDHSSSGSFGHRKYVICYELLIWSPASC